MFDHLLATEVDANGGGTYTSIQHYVLDVSPEAPAAGVPGTALAQPDLEFDGGGNLIQRNLVALDPAGVDAVLAQEAVTSLGQGGVNTWMADNNLGSVVDITDDSGVLANHFVYASFGQIAYESNTSVVPWAGFGDGHQDPNTGLVNDYHRWLNTADGKWLSNDPRTFAAGDVDLSRYVHDEPLAYHDSTGLQPPNGGAYGGYGGGGPYGGGYYQGPRGGAYGGYGAGGAMVPAH